MDGGWTWSRWQLDQIMMSYLGSLFTIQRFCAWAAGQEGGTRCYIELWNTSNKSLLVYRLVHAPVTRESGVRLPDREFVFLCLYEVWCQLLPFSAGQYSIVREAKGQDVICVLRAWHYR